MLSRVAESLYWTARHLERAEDVTRALDVTFHALLEARAGGRDEAWRRVLLMLGDEEAFAERYDTVTAATVGEWVLWHEDNPNAVAACVVLARENARSVREQVSGEMWEAVNNLFLLVRGANRAAVLRGPHGFFEQIRNGAHLFQGTADATMVQGEPYEFLQLGFHLERAEKTTRIVGAYYPEATGLAEDDPARARSLVALLKSCSAFEAYVRRHGMRIEPQPIVEELIRSSASPRSALYCLTRCRRAVDAISDGTGSLDHVLGRLCADVEYGEMTDVSGAVVSRALANLLYGINAAGDTVARTYFSGRALPHGALSAQEAQQQQCG
jgi:uncharacterized alpha-E superfamily protein